MARVRIATFNVENLFARYRFSSSQNPETAVRDGWKADSRRFDIHTPTSKRITAEAINVMRADILALQEVENLDTLKRFRSRFLKRGGYRGRRVYPYLALLDGNDPRQIDVAVLSRLPIVSATTWQHIWDSKRRSYVFSRDCLEVDLQMPDDSVLTVYVNHFKSMIGGRANTRQRRQRQVRKVKALVKARFGRDAGRHPFVIVGDFNDYTGTGSGVGNLVKWNQVENVVDRLPRDERWTHYFARRREYRQLDYILLSKALARRNPGLPHIERRGVPIRADRFAGERFRGVGRDRPKASDHCPVAMDLRF